MILWFSATGNSRYVAQKIAKIIDDETVNLFDRIRNGDNSPLTSEKPWVLVCPTYAWQIPHIVAQWLEKTELNGSKKIYTVMTCGGEIANAGEPLRRLCSKKNLKYYGCAGIVMPDNYFVMFEEVPPEKAKRIIMDSEGRISEIADLIKDGKRLPEPEKKLLYKLYSGIINKVFYGMSVTAKPFYSTDACVGCGKCEKVCPLGNVSLKDGKPAWGDKCTHCMACICLCPTGAIEYGKKTKGKIRYHFPENINI